jgi:biopolymer transport protein ExbD
VIARISRNAIKVVSFVVLTACSQTTPETVARLEVDSVGAVFLNGKAVPESRLVEELQTLQKASPNLSLEIWAAPDANHQVVSKAVASAQSARIAVIRFVADRSSQAAKP